MSLPLPYNSSNRQILLLSTVEVERIGFKLTIYPVSALLTVSRAISNLMSELKTIGTTTGRLDSTVSLQGCFKSVVLPDMLAQGGVAAAVT